MKKPAGRKPPVEPMVWMDLDIGGGKVLHVVFSTTGGLSAGLVQLLEHQVVAMKFLDNVGGVLDLGKVG